VTGDFHSLLRRFSSSIRVRTPRFHESGNTLVPTLVFAILLTATCARAQDHAGIGLALAREGKLAEAESELRKAVHAAPGEALPRAQLASILGLQRKWNEALESFQDAVNLDPANLNFRRETAAVQYQLRQMKAAEINLRYVLAKHPDDRGATLLLGLVSEANGDYATAARLLSSQFELVLSQPDRMVAFFHSSLQSGQRDNIPKIVGALQTRANDPAWGEAIGRCTIIAASGGDLPTAEALFLLLPKNQPSRPAAGFELAKLRYRQGQTEAAKGLLLQLSGSGKEGANIQTLLGHSYEALQQPGLALQAYQRSVELDPSNMDRYEDLISLQLKLGRNSDATVLTRHLTSVAPGDAKTWVLKANVDLHTNAFQAALKSYTRAASLDPSNADAVLGVASTHALLGANDEALADYKAGIKRFPGDSRFYLALAAALLASPNVPQSYLQIKNLLLQAVKLDSHSPDAHYQLGQLALKQGQLNEAKTEFLVSMEADQNRSNTHFALSLAYRRLGEDEDAAKEFAIYEKLKSAEEGEPAMSGQVSNQP
jgi:tetratricopeptide (TPR) repeat protein